MLKRCLKILKCKDTKRHLQQNPEGMHRVAYGRFTSKREAIKLLYFIKYTLKEDAWYLEENKPTFSLTTDGVLFSIVKMLNEGSFSRLRLENTLLEPALLPPSGL